MNSSTAAPGGLGSSYASLHQNEQDHAAATAAAALGHDGSDEHTPTPNGNSRKRKAVAAPGSRGVANLTPDQLAKKRANDREAQRAIRQRTKDTIDTLANRIKELESQQPFQDLQKVMQERDRALQECEELKKKLATVASVIGGSNGQQQTQQQPNLHGMYDAFDQFIDPTLLTESNSELAAVTAQQSPLPPLNTASGPPQYPQASAGAPYEQQHIHPDLRSPQSATHSSPGSQVASASSAYHSEGPGMRRWSPSLDQPHSTHYSPPNNLAYEQRVPQTAQMQTQTNGERLDLNYVLAPQQHPSKSSPNMPQRPQYTSSPARPEPLYLRLPKNSPPECPLDSLLLDFFSGRRQKYASGMLMKDVAGPKYPYLYALVEPSAVYSKHCHPVSALLIDILSKFPYIDALPEKVAVLHIMFLILRWEICPCEECYELVPVWARPTTEQLEIAHPAWHDHTPW